MVMFEGDGRWLFYLIVVLCTSLAGGVFMWLGRALYFGFCGGYFFWDGPVKGWD